jgi:DNA-binding XRE family transcriptional regulator
VSPQSTTDSRPVVDAGSVASVAISGGGNVIWAQKIFAPSPIEHEFEDASAFLDRFESEHPEWASGLASARTDFARTGIAESRLSSVARARLTAGFSQAELAKRVGTSQSHIARLESKALDPQLSTLVRIAEAVNVPIGTLARLMAEESAAHSDGT